MKTCEYHSFCGFGTGTLESTLCPPWLGVWMDDWGLVDPFVGIREVRQDQKVWNKVTYPNLLKRLWAFLYGLPPSRTASVAGALRVRNVHAGGLRLVLPASSLEAKSPCVFQLLIEKTILYSTLLSMMKLLHQKLTEMGDLFEAKSRRSAPKMRSDGLNMTTELDLNTFG